MKNNNDFKNELKLFHLAIFGIFIVSLTIRLYGVFSINITNPEAEFLLAISDIKPFGSVNFFYGLIIRIMQFIGIDSDLGVRTVNAVMGALVTILPSLFNKEIGKRTAVISSLLLSFDPFGIANSIVFSGNISTVLFIGLLIEAIVHERKSLIYMAILLLIGHGRGLGYLIFALLNLLIYIYFFSRKIFYKTLTRFKEKIALNNKSSIAGVGIVTVVFLAIIFKIPLSYIASDISSFIIGWGSNYQTGNYPIVFPFAIISYIPVAMIFTLIGLFKKRDNENKYIGLCALWILLTFTIIAFYPRHLLIDLVWISIPICIFASKIIDEYFSINFQLLKNDWLFPTVLFFTGISLILNLISIVYRSVWGLDVTNTLLATVTITIFAVVLLLYRAYTSSFSKVLSALILVSIIFGSLLQISVSARTFGSNKKPQNEIIWNGYFEDQTIVREIVEDTKNNLKGTAGKLNAFIDGEPKPSVVWFLNNERLFFQKSDLLSNQPEIVLAGNQPIMINNNDYQGQEFISNSYPLWTWDPVRSFKSPDYWNWFLFRNNLQYKEYNSIWINKTLVNDRIRIGAN